MRVHVAERGVMEHAGQRADDFKPEREPQIHRRLVRHHHEIELAARDSPARLRRLPSRSDCMKVAVDLSPRIDADEKAASRSDA